MKNIKKIKSSLKEHLINLGFKFFDHSDQYNIYIENYFKNINISIEIKKKYLKFLEKNLINKSYNLGYDFYDFIAECRKLMLITHSMKSNEILNCGQSIINEFKENSNILDIGCNSGYLTSFYAKIFSNSNFIGLDKSKNSILQAKRMPNFEKYSNLFFTSDYSNINKYKFNFVSDTQCLSTLKKKDLINTLDLLKDGLHSNVKIISISNLRNEEEAAIFFKILFNQGYYVNSISPLIINTLSGIVAYTKIIFTKKKNDNKYNLSVYFSRIRRKISIVNLFKLN